MGTESITSMDTEEFRTGIDFRCVVLIQFPDTLYQHQRCGDPHDLASRVKEIVERHTASPNNLSLRPDKPFGFAQDRLVGGAAQELMGFDYPKYLLYERTGFQYFMRVDFSDMV